MQAVQTIFGCIRLSLVCDPRPILIVPLSLKLHPHQLHLQTVGWVPTFFFFDSETPVDTNVIHLYMHDMASQYDNMLKSTLQVNAKHAVVSSAVYMGLGYGQIHSPRLNL